jgi:hypothetical protein
MYAAPHPDDLAKHGATQPHSTHDESLHTWLEDEANSPKSNRGQIVEFHNPQPHTGKLDDFHSPHRRSSQGGAAEMDF